MLESYYYFYCVAKVGSITKTAEKMFISQPGLSKAIAKLEEELGCQLFERTAKGVRLTMEGKTLYESVDHIASILGSTKNKLKDMNHEAYGEIVIGSGDELINNFLAPAAVDYFTKYPNVILSNPGSRCSDDIVQNLLHGDVDIGLVNRPPDNAQVESFCLGMQSFAFICGVKYWNLVSGGSVSLKELQPYPLLTYPAHTYTRSLFDKYAKSHGLTYYVRIESGSISVLLGLARENHGVALVTRESAMPFIAHNLLFEIPVKESLGERPAYMIWRKDEALPKHVRLFIQEIIDFTNRKREALPSTLD